MAEFAQLDADNVVVCVLVVPDDQAHRGEEFLSVDLALGGRWMLVTDENNERRYRSGVGFIYNQTHDVFVSPQPAPWFVFDDNFDWVCPDGINPETGNPYTEEELLIIQLDASLNDVFMEGDANV